MELRGERAMVQRGIAVVTGGATRVGAVIVRALAAAGWDVLVHFGRNAEGASEVRAAVEALGRRCATVGADLVTDDGIDALAGAARAFAGDAGVGLLVHNAANFERVEPSLLDGSEWDRAMALNARAPYRLTVALRGALDAAEGCVVAITCTSASRPWKNYVGYSVSKAALEHAMQALALALAPRVRCACVAPGTVMAPDGYDEAKRGGMAKKIPLERFGAPEDVANAVLFLAHNRFVTGVTLTVDGGRVLA
jgi:pteridine reductase